MVWSRSARIRGVALGGCLNFDVVVLRINQRSKVIVMGLKKIFFLGT